LVQLLMTPPTVGEACVTLVSASTSTDQCLAACEPASRDPRQLREKRVVCFAQAWWLWSYSRTPTHDTGRFGFCDLVVRGLSRTAVTGDLLTEASHEPLASCDAAFSCLLRLGGQSGTNEIGAVHCRNVVNGETLSISRLIELAGDLGLKAEHAQLDWLRLQALGSSRPLLALLKNTNVVVLTVGGRGGVSEVAVWDPLNPFGEILFVLREDFERAWTGHTLIVTTSPSNGAEMSPSLDFCWFTSAGLELLGKTSARGQNPKPPVQKREKTGARRKPRARRTPRQTDRAIALAARGELDLVRIELANEQMLPDPRRDAQPSTPVLSRPAAERSLSSLVRFCTAAGGILAAAGIGTLLLQNSATGPVTAATTLAKEVWTVAPEGAWSPDRRIASIPRPGTTPILASPSATPADGHSFAAPPATPADGHSFAAPPATPADGHSFAAPPATPADGHSFAAPPATPADGHSFAAPPATPADGHSFAAPPATPADGHSFAAPAATPADGHSFAAPPAASADGHSLTRPPATPSLAAVPTALADRPDVAAPSSKPGLAMPATTPDAESAAPHPTAGSRLSAVDMEALLARGDTLLSVGDVVSARLFYERAVDAGGGLAAIRLGETFDPLFLDRAHLHGVRGDPGAALLWYRRARDLGASDAEVLLKALEAK